MTTVVQTAWTSQLITDDGLPKYDGQNISGADDDCRFTAANGSSESSLCDIYNKSDDIICADGSSGVVCCRLRRSVTSDACPRPCRVTRSWVVRRRHSELPYQMPVPMSPGTITTITAAPLMAGPPLPMHSPPSGSSTG